MSMHFSVASSSLHTRVKSAVFFLPIYFQVISFVLPSINILPLNRSLPSLSLPPHQAQSFQVQPTFLSLTPALGVQASTGFLCVTGAPCQYLPSLATLCSVVTVWGRRATGGEKRTRRRNENEWKGRQNI